jgi:formate C-acetyltransferase
MIAHPDTSDRISGLRHRYLDEVAIISIQRARFYTESWKKTETSGLSRGERVALAMKNVYEKMDFCIDRDDRIAGAWTEHFLGVPIDIEKGLFNDVFSVELSKRTMVFHILKDDLRFIAYMIRRYGLLFLLKSLRETKAVGAAMPSIGTTTMDKRRVNPCTMKKKDKRILLRELLPFWRGKTIADRLKERLLEEKVFTGDMESFSASLPSTTSRKDIVISLGAAMGVWQGHLILDHETPLKKGLLAMRQDVQERIDRANHTEEELQFLRSQVIALDGVITFSERLGRFVRQAYENDGDPQKKEILGLMAENTASVPLGPARTFREAVQSYWTVKTAVELAVPFNVHAPGRLDQYFWPYYEKDVREGKITKEQAREILEELLLKIMTHNMRPDSNYQGSFGQRYEGSEPVTLGGLTPEGRDATNELTYLVLEAAHRSKTALNIVVRIHPNSPERLLLAVADLHYNGTSSISLMNDEVSIAAMKKRGFSETDANDYAITGCVDMCAPGKTGGIGFSALLMARTLDMTLRNGDAKTLVGTVRGVGLRTGDPGSFGSFDEFFDAYVLQAQNMIRLIVRASHIRDRLYAQQLPAPYISVFMQGCLDNKRDVTRGGAIYDLEGILFMNSIANVVDSLFVIKKLIFEKKVFDFRRLVAAVDHNFVGYEDIHRMILALDGKWGNGNPESDTLAHALTTRLFEETYLHETFKGGIFAPFINSMTSHTFDGRVSLATPDGRKAAKPYAASCNPYNVDTRGLTGVLRSVAALDFTHVLGCAVNVRLHPSAIGRSTEARAKYSSLIRTYFKLGGQQLQPTVASTEVLKHAQAEPEDYRDLIVKVGGYSAYFVDLGREIQDEIISRSEHAKNG